MTSPLFLPTTTSIQSEAPRSHSRPLGQAVDDASYLGVDQFERATPELLRRRELLDRVDRKFLVPVAKIPLLLNLIRHDYGVLSAGGETWANYETCYFDTPSLTCFYEHMRGRRPRFKVRVRHHPARSKSFLEVKRKDASDKTFKSRVERAFGDADLSDQDFLFLAKHTPPSLRVLVPSVWTNFRRATFLGVDVNERLTIDLGLTFVRGGSSVSRDSLAIVELKQPRFSHQTPAALALRALHIREASLSKYCAGISELHTDASPRAKRTMQLRAQRAFR